MKSYLIAIYSLIVILSTSCVFSHQKKVESEQINSFKLEVFDSLQIGSDKIIRLLDNNDAIIVYWGNSECSECIADLDEFNDYYIDSGIKTPCIYIISGSDTLIVDYYIRQNKISFSNNVIIVYDTTYCFNNFMPEYNPNQIFILKKDSLARRIMDFNTNDKEEWNYLFTVLIRK